MPDKPVFELHESLWAIIERGQKALRNSGAKEWTIEEFTNEALAVPDITTAYGYDRLMQVLTKYFDLK